MSKIKNNDWKDFGIGPELLPLKHLNFKTSYKYKDKGYSLAPIKVLTTKDETDMYFRTFSFVDKKCLSDLNEFIDENKQIICDFLSNINGDKVSQYQIFENNNDEYNFVNLIEFKSISRNPNISYNDSLYDEIERSAIYKFNLNIDISKFYDSIYTHSFTWIDDPNIKIISNKLDDKLKFVNGNMTHGIPTGPIASKIVSEIILTEVLLKLKKKITNIDCHVHRFADDFTIYFNKHEDFIWIAKCLSIILNEFKLSINKEKLDSNYTYKRNNFKSIKIEYGSEDKWEIVFEELIMNFANIKDVANKAKHLLINTIDNIDNLKERTTFYKWILKSWNKNHILKIIESDEELLKLILNFAINYIVITDSSLNIPISYLGVLTKINNDAIRDKYLNIISNIYKTTDSEMKKIFIFDFLKDINKTGLVIESINVNKLLETKQYLHIAQLLESTVISFNQLDVESPILSNHRLSDTWILWIYASKEKIRQICNSNIEKIIEDLVEEREYYKPFHYC